MADTVQSPPATPPLPWWVVPGIVYTIIVAFLVFSGIIIWRADDKYEQIVLIAVIGSATTGLGFYVGSSKGSENKDATLASTSAALATSAPITSTGDGDSPSEPSDAAKALDAKLQAANG